MSLLDEFYAKLGVSSQTEFHKKFMPEPYNGRLYHYTSPSGLTSILFGDTRAMTLWASRYDVQNDVLEGTLAVEVYKKVCEKIDCAKKMLINLESIKPTRTFLIQSKVNGKIKTTRPECEEYICCFSTNPDSLSMWNYYAKGNAYEGYNIGIDTAKLQDSLTYYYQDIEVSSEIYPVIYDRQKQEELVELFMQEVLSQYDPDNQDHRFSISYIISNQLSMWQLLFKSRFFEHENEVRAIIRVAKPTLKKEPPVAIKYRTKGMYVIPYIEMKLDKNCLSSVVIGPQQWSERQKMHQVETIEGILKRNQYSASVACSEAPIRY